MTATASATQAVLRTPQELYNDWERAHWAAQDIDLSRDPGDWAALGDGERELLHFVLGSLMVSPRSGSRPSSAGWCSPRTTRRRAATCPPSSSTRFATCSSTPASRTR